MSKLTLDQIKIQSKTIPNWSRRGQSIVRTFKFKGFLESVAFVQKLAKRAEKLNHHPDIDIRYDSVTLKLTTHDEGGLTTVDFLLARQCDEIQAKLSEA